MECIFSSVPTSMLAVFQLVKTLISANMYKMRSTCVVHRFLKRKVVVNHKERSFCTKEYALAHVYITACCLNDAWNAFR